jgi:chromate transporter
LLPVVVLFAVFITGVVAWLYKQYGQLQIFNLLFTCIKPAIIAIILPAIFPLAKKSFKSKEELF